MIYAQGVKYIAILFSSLFRFFSGQHWVKGPTYGCNNKICRGARPHCEDPNAQEWGCFCVNPNRFQDGSKCVKKCPLYP